MSHIWEVLHTGPVTWRSHLDWSPAPSLCRYRAHHTATCLTFPGERFSFPDLNPKLSPERFWTRIYPPPILLPPERILEVPGRHLLRMEEGSYQYYCLKAKTMSWALPSCSWTQAAAKEGCGAAGGGHVCYCWQGVLWSHWSVHSFRLVLTEERGSKSESHFGIPCLLSLRSV